MNAVLICPSTRPDVERVARLAPLAGLPLLGESLLEYWLSHLAQAGTEHVRLLVHDRPAYIAAIAGTGARWGLNIELIHESRELSQAQAQIKYGAELESEPDEIEVLDHFPGSIQPLFTSYSDLIAGIFEWVPNARTPDRVGIRELRPGVWVGSQTKISPCAQVHAPCWLGQNVYVGARAVVGPMAVVEDRSFIEPDSEIVSSVIGPDTFVGRHAVIQNSFAWGGTLIDWKSGQCIEVDDPLLLSALRTFGAPAEVQENLLSRLTEIYTRNKDELQMFWKHLLMNREG